MAELFHSIEWLEHDDAIITTRRERIFRDPVYRRYRGNCTVWHDAETGKRVGLIGGEEWLCDQWTREKWKREDREATDDG